MSVRRKARRVTWDAARVLRAVVSIERRPSSELPQREIDGRSVTVQPPPSALISSTLAVIRLVRMFALNLIGQRCALGRDDLQIGGDARLIASG